MPERTSLRAGAVLGLLGVLVFFVATALHPSSIDPNDAVAAFREYAGLPCWDEAKGQSALLPQTAPN